MSNFQQATHLTYKLDRYYLVRTSSSRHAAIEDYYFKGDYAIYHPNLLNGSFTLGFRLDQDYSSDNARDSRFATGHGIFYDIRGILLEKRPTPLSFFLNSKLDEISDGFGQNYQIETRSFGLNLGLQNAHLPAGISYTSSVSETDGLATDSRSTREDLSIRARHERGISETLLDLLFTREDFVAPATGEADSNDSSELYLRNNLRWEKGLLGRYLNSSVRYGKAVGINDRENFDWSETLTWDLGKALRSGLNYSFNEAESGPNQRRANSGRAWLQHELYKSLTTHLEGYARDVQFFPGSEQVTGGRASLGYRKALPARSNLNANLYRQYQVTDRHFEATTLTIFNEPRTVSFAEQLLLDNPNVLPETVVVRNANPLIQLTPYVADIDYRLVQIGDRTEIVVNAPELSNIIAEGTLLLVTYDVLVNPDVRFASDGWGASTQLRLLGDRYRIYSSLDQSENHLLSGQTSRVGLDRSQTIFRFGAETKWNRYTLASEYRKFDSATNHYQSLDGRLRYTGSWGKESLTLYLENRYWWYDFPEDRRPVEDRSTLKVGGKYRRPVFGTVRFSTWADYLKSMGEVDSDLVTLGADLRWQYRKLSLSLRSWAGFRRFTDDWSREEHVRFDLTRYF